jgi:hypothetical protein
MTDGRAHLVAEEATADVDLLASDDDNLLAVEDLLGDYGRQAAEQMALAVNDDRRRGKGRHVGDWIYVSLDKTIS